ncbi:MAG: branched-chain amino acid ABC transporter substrate-binding protein [Chloroflexota bacterium]
MLATACSAGGSPTAGPACSGAVIKVAADFPTTGADGPLGRPASLGAQFAVESRKCAGPYRLQFAAFDDAAGGTGVHDPATGARNVEKMLADPQVLGMVGPLDSNVARAEIPVANLNGLAMVSPSNTDECLTQALAYCPAPPTALRPGGGNNYFRLAADNTVQGPAAAAFVVDNLKLNAVAVLSDNETLGKAAADGFSAELRGRGGRVVLRQDFDWRAQNDYAAFFQLARQQGAQAVYAGMTSQTHGCTVRPAMKGVLDVPFVGPDGIVDDQCLKDAASAADGMYATVTVGDATQSTEPAVKSVVAAYRKRFGDTALSAFTFPSYDAAALLVDAIARAAGAAGGMPTRKQVIEAVARTSAFKGTTGTFTFNAAGDPVQPTVSVYKTQGGGWVFATQSPVSRRA